MKPLWFRFHLLFLYRCYPRSQLIVDCIHLGGVSLFDAPSVGEVTAQPFALFGRFLQLVLGLGLQYLIVVEDSTLYAPLRLLLRGSEPQHQKRLLPNGREGRVPQDCFSGLLPCLFVAVVPG